LGAAGDLEQHMGSATFIALFIIVVAAIIVYRARK
jgi:hypothetical protein